MTIDQALSIFKGHIPLYVIGMEDGEPKIKGDIVFLEAFNTIENHIHKQDDDIKSLACLLKYHVVDENQIAIYLNGWGMGDECLNIYSRDNIKTYTRLLKKGE